MKKVIYLLIFIIILSGCGKKDEVIEPKDEEQKEQEQKEEIPKEEVYIDFNNTPISFYKNKNKIDDIKKNIQVGKDIILLNIYPSKDSTLSYNSFGESFYNAWSNYNKNNNLKIGFNLKYNTLDNGEISHTILKYEDTKIYEGYILIFLYDDYDIYKNNKIYSHIEKDLESTLYSSIKLYPQSAFPNVNSKITLTVFTYDGEDDFDEKGEYRGNSKSILTICDTNKTC